MVFGVGVKKAAEDYQMHKVRSEEDEMGEIFDRLKDEF